MMKSCVGSPLYMAPEVLNGKYNEKLLHPAVRNDSGMQQKDKK